MKAEEVCKRAAELVSGDRQRQHGDKKENFANIAALWSAWLGIDLEPSDVAALMLLMKLARTQSGTFNQDDYVDMAGYSGCMAEVME